MTSVEEASEFFQRRGFASVALEVTWTGKEHVMVGIQGDSEREDESGILPRCWGKCVLTTNRPGWAVTYRLDGRMQEFLFDSLSDAVNHVLAQLQLCLLRGTALDRE